jgi:DNA-binding LacI/PurR family transcriptional regulator
LHDPRRPRGLTDWLRRSGADALIVSTVAHLAVPGVRAFCRAARLPVATLRLAGKIQSAIGGIDQGDELLGAQAVELLIAQLNHNERGPPRQPGMMLFPGRWVPATGEAPARSREKNDGAAAAVS